MDYTEDLWTDIIFADGSHLVACTCYHPSKPKYNTRDFTDHPDNVYILTGDLNQMDSTKFETQLGFVQLVQSPTHNKSIIDKFLRNRPDLFNIQVMQSLVKTRHKSLLVSFNKLDRTDTNVKLRSKVVVWLCNPTAASLLNQAFCNYNCNSVINLSVCVYNVALVYS